jgi:thioredoxin-like negative regulator of GroEL
LKLDATDACFEDGVLLRSETAPVSVDFGCDPCETLSRITKSVVDADADTSGLSARSFRSWLIRR